MIGLYILDTLTGCKMPITNRTDAAPFKLCKGKPYRKWLRKTYGATATHHLGITWYSPVLKRTLVQKAFDYGTGRYYADPTDPTKRFFLVADAPVKMIYSKYVDGLYCGITWKDALGTPELGLVHTSYHKGKVGLWIPAGKVICGVARKAAVIPTLPPKYRKGFTEHLHVYSALNGVSVLPSRLIKSLA